MPFLLLARRRPSSPSTREGESGQSLVEFTLILPIFMFLLLIMLELGFAFNHNLTIGVATREGAPTGAALADGGVANCAGGNDPAGVDQEIIAGVQRILVSPGSDIEMADISQIRIFRVSPGGNEVASDVNVWVPAMTSAVPPAPTGIDIDPGTAVDRLYFSESTVTWPACERDNGGNPDSLGVAILYTYHLKTALSAFTGSVMKGNQPAQITMNDQTVMVLGPTN